MSEHAAAATEAESGFALLRRLPLMEKAAVLLFAVLFCTLLVQVLLRPFDIAVVWIGELGIPVFVWIVFIGAAIASRRREHPFVEIGYLAASRRLSPRGRLFLDLVLGLAAILFYAVFIAGLVAMTVQTWDHVPGILPGYRVGFLYLGALVGVAGCLIATAAHLATTWRMRGQAPDAPRNGGDASSII